MSEEDNFTGKVLTNPPGSLRLRQEAKAYTTSVRLVCNGAQYMPASMREKILAYFSGAGMTGTYGIFMAIVLEGSGIAEELYVTMHRWFGAFPGGLASGTVVICAIFAAMAGISGVATVTMGLIALPAMLKRGYDRKMVVGAIACGGALGIIIPPSVIAILYGAITGSSIGKLFMEGMIPGIFIAIVMIIYITAKCTINPSLGPPVPREERATWREKFVSLKNVGRILRNAALSCPDKITSVIV